jgi:hypothetical protein
MKMVARKKEGIARPKVASQAHRFGAHRCQPKQKADDQCEEKGNCQQPKAVEGGFQNGGTDGVGHAQRHGVKFQAEGSGQVVPIERQDIRRSGHAGAEGILSAHHHHGDLGIGKPGEVGCQHSQRDDENSAQDETEQTLIFLLPEG